MGKELFGTDGMRGVAGEYPLDAVTVHALGIALGEDLKKASPDPEVLIGMDTRESGPWIAEQVAGGLAREGVRVRSAGVVTTPGVAYLTRTGPFVAGVMISASHNPFRDNGIKVFTHSGYKLPDDEEDLVERDIFRLRAAGVEPAAAPLAADPSLDRLYLAYLVSTATVRLDGVKLAIDAGNGAAFQLAPELFRRLGAEVSCVACQPDGRNINLDCGALHVENLRRHVKETGADFGAAFDGDADRAMLVSRSGKIIDGDAMLYLAARSLKADGCLAGDLVVATVMSNLGLEKSLERDGIRLLRTAVGDKYVLEEMVRVGAVIGGEQSGHVIFRQYATTGDGMLTALRIFEIASRAGAGLDELTAGLPVYPQRLVNVRVREKKPFAELPAVDEAIRRSEESFGGSGRVLVRYSGTEPLARVMVEGPDLKLVEDSTARIAAAIQREIGISKGA